MVDYAVRETARPDVRWGAALVPLVLGAFLTVLAAAVISTGVTRIRQSLDIPAADMQYVSIGYNVVLGAVITVSGWMSQRLGPARLFVRALIGFGIGSGLVGLAWNLESLLAFRAVEAVAAGMVPVTSLTLLVATVPGHRLGLAFGLYGAGIITAPAIGPALGGLFYEHVGWRLLFVLLMLAAFLAAFLTRRALPMDRPASWGRLDVWGFLTLGYVLTAVLVAVVQAQQERWDWNGYPVLALFSTAAMGLAVFVVIENEVEHPLIDLRVFRHPRFCLSLVLLVVAIITIFTSLSYTSQFLLQVQSRTEFGAGLVLLAPGLVLPVMALLGGTLYGRFGPRYVLLAGMVLIAAGSYLAAQIDIDTPTADLQVWIAVRYLGAGLCVVSVLAAATAALPHSLGPSGSALTQVTQRAVISLLFAFFGGVNYVKSTQLTTDRSALMGENAYARNQLAGARGLPVREPTTEVIGAYQQLQGFANTETYANIFTVVAVLGVVGAGLALFMPSGRPE